MDYSKEERETIKELLKVLGESGSLDELGVGIVRDSISDILYPGTSVLHTRAKYYILIPYRAKKSGQRGGLNMSYICGKSRNKIVHTQECRYVKMIPDNNKKYYRSLQEASDAGYVQCRYCAYIKKYLKGNERDLEKYCRLNGVYFYFNPSDGSIDVISKSGKWKIIVNGQKHYIWLYHKNNHGCNYEDFVPGYHSQKIRCNTLQGYMDYIIKHDQYREEDPLYENQKHNTVKGSKKWKKQKKRADRIRRTQSIRYVRALIDNIALGNIAY